MATTSKMLGDAGEHYAVSQFSFAGRPATKMPDGWKDYDLAVDDGAQLVKVSVKTRSESEGWKTSRWFNFDQKRVCDWFVFCFHGREGVRAWVIPFAVALKHANNPGPNRKDAHLRDISFSRLQKAPLKGYEGNWALRPDP